MSIDVPADPETAGLVVGLLPRDEGPADPLGFGPPADVVSACVFADDPLEGENLLTPLRASPEVQVLPADRHAGADVVVVAAGAVTGTLLDAVEDLAARAENPRRRLVLVSGPLRGSQLTRAVGCGVVGILPRATCTPSVLVRAVVAAANGGAVVPEAVTRWLLDEARTFQRTILTGQGLTTGGLTRRETEVLRLLAEGLDTGAVAARLGFSERMIKKILQDVTRRLHLRNRTHAVSYALRAGAI